MLYSISYDTDAGRRGGTSAARSPVSYPMRYSHTRAEPAPVWGAPQARPAEAAFETVTPEQQAAQRQQPIYEITGWRYWLLLVPIALTLRLYFATLRIKMDAVDEGALRDTSRPLMSVLWHNRSLMVPLVGRHLRKPEKMTCLISPSKAAAWEVALFAFDKIGAVRGSSTRRSIQGTRDIIKAYRTGQDMWLSPDGPSGPLYEFKRGAVAIARMTKCPVLLWGADAPSAWRPKTWDRHFIPLPFSTIRLRGRIVEHADIFPAGRDDAAAGEYLRQRLMELNVDPF